MIRVYKTDVQCPQTAADIMNELLKQSPDFRVNFDLQDCDHVLRIEGTTFETEQVRNVVGKFGFACEELI
jgi:hypothetical protein